MSNDVEKAADEFLHRKPRRNHKNLKRGFLAGAAYKHEKLEQRVRELEMENETLKKDLSQAMDKAKSRGRRLASALWALRKYRGISVPKPVLRGTFYTLVADFALKDDRALRGGKETK